jgi:hypothetical protein
VVLAVEAEDKIVRLLHHQPQEFPTLALAVVVVANLSMALTVALVLSSLDMQSNKEIYVKCN